MLYFSNKKLLGGNSGANMKNYEINVLLKDEPILFKGQAEDMLEMLERWATVLQKQKAAGKALPQIMEIYEVL